MRTFQMLASVVGLSAAMTANAAIAQGISEMGAVYGSSAASTNSMFGSGIGGALKNIYGAAGAGIRSTTEGYSPSDDASTMRTNVYKAVQISNKLCAQAQQKQKAGKLLEAEQLYRQAVYYREQIWGASDPAVQRLYLIIGALARKRGAYGEAEDCYHRVLTYQIKQNGPGNYEMAPYLTQLGDVLMDEKKYSEAVNAYDQSYKLKERKLGAEHTETVRAAIVLAKAYDAAGNVADAADLMKMYAEMLDKGSDAVNPQLIAVLETYVVTLHQAGANEQAERVQNRCDELKKLMAAAHASEKEKAPGDKAPASKENKAETGAVKALDKEPSKTTP